MSSLLVLAACSFLLSFFLTPFCRDMAVALGAVEYPDTFRKLHARPIPRLGGIPVFVAFGLSYCALLLFDLKFVIVEGQKLSLVLGLLPALVVIFVIGLADDLGGLKPWQKLAGQVIAAGLACWSGVLIRGIAGQAIPGWWIYPVTMLWLIGCTNAFNLIDGMDGLAAGVALFAGLTTFLAAVMHGDAGLQLVAIPLVGALLGFLRYNFNPASMFLGDCGSLTIGFLLGCCAVVWSQKATTFLGMTAPLIALSIPLLDTCLAVFRRLLRGQSIFEADRRHIHHRLLDRGLTPSHVALLLYGICAIAAVLALVQSVARDGVATLVIVIVCVSAWSGVHYLGYVEFNFAGRIPGPRAVRRIVSAQFRLRTLEARLERADAIEDCWGAIRDAAGGFGFTQVSMRLGHRVFENRRKDPSKDDLVLFVPLSAKEFVRLACRLESAIEPTAVGPFAILLHEALTSKLPRFAAARSGNLTTVGEVVGREKAFPQFRPGSENPDRVEASA